MAHRLQKSSIWLFLATGILVGNVGCDDSAKKPVQVRPAQIALPSQEPIQIPLPLEAQRQSLPPLVVRAPYGPEQLGAESQAAFDAGELDFKAGHLGKAREEFDDALD